MPIISSIPATNARLIAGLERGTSAISAGSAQPFPTGGESDE
jgi:hypothetical protein